MDEGREINLNRWRRVIFNIQTEGGKEKEKVSVFSRVYKVFQNLRNRRTGTGRRTIRVINYKNGIPFSTNASLTLSSIFKLTG
jgi:hypothetical protein